MKEQENDISAKSYVYKRQCRQRPPCLCQLICANDLSFKLHVNFRRPQFHEVLRRCEALIPQRGHFYVEEWLVPAH